MKFDISLFPRDLSRAAETARQIEALGFDGLWTAEADHNPFLPLTLAASATDRLTLGTQIAVAFPRSPMLVAQTAWDLAQQSDGRFVLGLGTQVEAHITRRFSTPWTAPVPRMREYVQSLRAIWHSFQTGEPLRYKGEHYRFLFLTPFFSPGPMENLAIPIYLAGVNEKVCALAGEVCDGLHAHAFHTTEYLREVVLASVDKGLQLSGRTRTDFELVVPIFIATGTDDSELQQVIEQTRVYIAFYASTPAYRAVMDLHGWSAVREKLSSMARRGEWAAMAHEISDGMLDTIAIVGKPDELLPKIRARYAGIADRVCIGWEREDESRRDVWHTVMS